MKKKLSLNALFSIFFSNELTIHFAPIPSLKVLWQMMFAELSNGESWCDNKNSINSVQFYSRGMWAMSEGVSLILNKRGKKKDGQVWLPDYFCNEPLAPLRRKKINLHFYPIRKDLSPDWNKLKGMAVKHGSPDILILVHYFGFINCIDAAKKFCNDYSVDLLEDCAHLLLPVNGCGQNNAFFSPKKLLSLPEGALLIIPYNDITRQVNVKYSANKKLILKWLILRLAQRLMLILGISWHRFRKTDSCQQNKDSCQVDKICEDGKIFSDRYSLKLLSVIEKSLQQVVEKRRANYASLLKSIGDVKNVKPLFSLLPSYICPYICPLIVSYGRNELVDELNHLGIPASSWPDLPPEVLQKKDEHKTAIWLQEHILLLPIHQDLSKNKMENIAFKLKEYIRKIG